MNEDLLLAADMLDGTFRPPVEMDDPALIGLLFGTLGLPFSNNVREVLARLTDGKVAPPAQVKAARADLFATDATCEEDQPPRSNQP